MYQVDDLFQVEFLTDVANSVFGMEPLAIIFSLPYALLMWRSATVDLWLQSETH